MMKLKEEKGNTILELPEGDRFQLDVLTEQSGIHALMVTPLLENDQKCRVFESDGTTVFVVAKPIFMGKDPESEVSA